HRNEQKIENYSTNQANQHTPSSILWMPEVCPVLEWVIQSRRENGGCQSRRPYDIIAATNRMRGGGDLWNIHRKSWNILARCNRKRRAQAIHSVPAAISFSPGFLCWSFCLHF